MTTAPKPFQREVVATEVLKCATAWEPDACLIDNVTARDIFLPVAPMLTFCPKCGVEPGCDINCNLCSLLHEALKET